MTSDLESEKKEKKKNKGKKREQRKEATKEGTVKKKEEEKKGKKRMRKGKTKRNCCTLGEITDLAFWACWGSAAGLGVTGAGCETGVETGFSCWATGFGVSGAGATVFWTGAFVEVACLNSRKIWVKKLKIWNKKGSKERNKKKEIKREEKKTRTEREEKQTKKS